MTGKGGAPAPEAQGMPYLSVDQLPQSGCSVRVDRRCAARAHHLKKRGQLGGVALVLVRHSPANSGRSATGVQAEGMPYYMRDYSYTKEAK